MATSKILKPTGGTFCYEITSIQDMLDLCNVLTASDVVLVHCTGTFSMACLGSSNNIQLQGQICKVAETKIDGVFYTISNGYGYMMRFDAESGTNPTVKKRWSTSNFS